MLEFDGGERLSLQKRLTLPEKIERSKALISAAWEKHGDGFAVAQSCHNNVLWSLAKEVDATHRAKIKGVSFMTRFEFPETLEYSYILDKKYPELHIRYGAGGIDTPEKPEGYGSMAQCCAEEKRKPFMAMLKEAGATCWAAGLRQDESPERQALKEYYVNINGLEKINPLCYWTEVDEWMYIALNKIDVNPLYAQGYRSIGCAPCTIKSNAGERAGRWPGRKEKECGCHAEVR